MDEQQVFADLGVTRGISVYGRRAKSDVGTVAWVVHGEVGGFAERREVVG